MKILSSFVDGAIAKLTQFAEARKPTSEFVCPDQGIIREIIETSYLASLHEEETRVVQCKICFFSDSRDALGSFNSLQFPRLIPFSAMNLVQLSMALNYKRSQLIVVRENECLFIAGIQTLGSDLEKTFAHERLATVFPRDYLTCCVAGPGKMIIMVGLTPLISIDKGEVQPNSPFVSQENPFQALFTSSLALAREHLASKSISFEIIDLWRLFVPFLDNLLRCVLEYSHGGMIVFLPQLAEGQKVEDFASVKYPVRKVSEEFWDRLLYHLEICNQFLGPEKISGEKDAIRYKFEKTKRKLLDLTELFGQLTQVDGAVVLSKTFHLFGFGAELEIRADLPRVHLIRPGVPAAEIDPTHFGTRHRSAFRLVGMLANALVFVFSSDGSIKAIYREGPKTCMLADVNKTRYGSIFGL